MLVAEDGGVRKQIDFDWENPFSLNQLQEAVCNFATIYQALWPMDSTPNILWRILTKYKWISAATSADIRQRVICKFFENVSRGNATRAVNGQQPTSYEQMEKTLKQVLISMGVSPEVPFTIPKQAGSSGANNNSSNGGGQKKSNNKPQAKKQDRKRAEKDGKGLCFGFNAMDGRSCENPSHGNGCMGRTDNKLYLHLCSQFVPAKNDYCYEAHRRKDHPR